MSLICLSDNLTWIPSNALTGTMLYLGYAREKPLPLGINSDAKCACSDERNEVDLQLQITIDPFVGAVGDRRRSTSEVGATHATLMLGWWWLRPGQ